MSQNICRICAIDTDSVKVTKLFEKRARILLRQINLVTGVLLEEKPDLPKVICSSCQNDLDCAINLRTRCLRNHSNWPLKQKSETEPATGAESTPVICVRQGARTRSRCVNENEKVPLSPIQSPVKVDRNIHSVVHDHVLHLETETCDDETDEADFIMSESEFCATEAVFSASEDKFYLPPTKTKRLTRARCASNDGKDEKSPLSPKVNTYVCGLREERPNNNAVVGDSVDDLKTKNKPLAKMITLKKPRANLLDPLYFCHQCGEIRNGKCAIDRHLRRHSDKRPWKCARCPSCFQTAGELKSHQLMHSGLRNYKCQHCELAFAHPSGLYYHKLSHNNERRFVCNECGMSFNRSFILKCHMRVHSDKRMFKCDFCDRSFKTKTHLTTHYRSKLHKKNV